MLGRVYSDRNWIHIKPIVNSDHKICDIGWSVIWDKSDYALYIVVWLQSLLPLLKILRFQRIAYYGNISCFISPLDSSDLYNQRVKVWMNWNQVYLISFCWTVPRVYMIHDFMTYCFLIKHFRPISFVKQSNRQNKFSKTSGYDHPSLCHCPLHYLPSLVQASLGNRKPEQLLEF